MFFFVIVNLFRDLNFSVFFFLLSLSCREIKLNSLMNNILILFENDRIYFESLINFEIWERFNMELVYYKINSNNIKIERRRNEEVGIKDI